MHRRPAWNCLVLFFCLACCGIAGHVTASPDNAASRHVPQTAAAETQADTYIITGQEWAEGAGASEAAQLGRLLILETAARMPDHTGNALNCAHCHQEAGTKPGAAPFAGVTRRFPMYRARIGREQTIEERIQDCFERSLAGTAPDADSIEVKAMVAYMTHLSRDVPPGAKLVGRGILRLAPPQESPDLVRGEALYQAKCVACHMTNGGGLKAPSGTVIFPALWGDDAFNIAAGMARLNTAAGFIKTNMPKGLEGTLSDQEAYDLALYVTRQARRDFARKHLDWPQGGRPEDARY